jgi:hypothetical protein
MLIQYYIADGQEIIWHTSGDIPTLADIDGIALTYAQKCPNKLPDSVFVNVRIYSQMVSSLYSSHQILMHDKPMGMTLLHIHTCVGVLKVIPMPYASDAKLFLVGRHEDFERYDIDKIFEEVVLKDCEKV